MRSYSSKEVIEILVAQGWVHKYSRGSHNYFIHSKHEGKVTVPHPRKDIPIGTLKSISKQTGINFD
ncbi:MAG TPA: type II toxin-antitoxin system HicA family toxin [Clostridia bacterium]|nr:type II toxin-antitoxin system HicA family toxin [Clostridia bacterium]